jgi:hypothetical protein
MIFGGDIELGPYKYSLGTTNLGQYLPKIVLHPTDGEEFGKKNWFPDGGNGPPPQPPTIRDPCGYMLRLSKKRLVINSERCSGDNSHEDHKALEAALTAFGVNLGEPVFALMMQAEVLQGLSPMVRFMKE